ncbi:hypothetical protein WJX72_011108 [[Myrmecia] bisecta]|uniref:Dynein intermediate chain n=1 Tax=[Myrmecia] bisecta TaxID=41462 RepID=A0AAW1QTE8_9CHLO
MPGFLKTLMKRKDKPPREGAPIPKQHTDMPSPLPSSKKQPGDDFDLPVKEVVKPDNQLQLPDKLLDEEVAKMLTANNPSAPKNMVRFSTKERVFKVEPMVEQLMVHYATDGWLLHKGSEEAKRQTDCDRAADEAAAKFQAEMDRGRRDRRDDGAGLGTDTDGPDDSRQLRNQFNFSERAAQTLNYPMCDRATTTEPPPTATMSGECSQWGIYDAYLLDQERQKLQEEVTKKGAAAKKSTTAGDNDPCEPARDTSKDDRGSTLHSAHMSRAAKVLERMENQNSYNDISMDFKYWDDASDAFRPDEGTLLPLWKFYPEQAKRKHVTSLCWNPEYFDMFAVGYGSFDFLKQSGGLACCYSLKNPSYPEYIFTTDSGVMCLDFHPQHPNLLAVGCYDGTVRVFDVRTKTNKPMYASTAVTGKHTDPVWQIFWQEADLQKQLQFYSVASDGRVTLWTLSKSELTHQDMMELKLLDPSEPDGDESTLASLASCCSFDFNKAQDHLFVVGTEEGQIHKCSTAFNSEYLQTYEGHAMAVYAVKWNQLHMKTFLSASADWTVKLWDSSLAKPIMTFDLSNSVGDVAWAPYSATVFAAITDDGKVHVFDLTQNKHEPMCEQKVVQKAKLTRIAFNPKHPVLLVGDDRGCVTCLKLSPNLRRSSKPDGKQTMQEAENAKLDHVLDIARKGTISPAEEAK